MDLTQDACFPQSADYSQISIRDVYFHEYILGGTDAQDAAHSTSVSYGDGDRTKKIDAFSEQNVRP